MFGQGFMGHSSAVTILLYDVDVNKTKADDS